MARWRKRFEAWAIAKQPVAVEEVEALIHRVFGDRVTEHLGTSHRWTIEVPELADVEGDFKFGHFGLPVGEGGKVKGIYCQIAYRAAQLLGLPENEK